MNNAAFEKTYINGSDIKPAGFNRVEFATKSLLLQINKTQSAYKQLSQNTSFSSDEFWYAVLGDMFSDDAYTSKNKNTDFLNHLKNAEQQLGLSTTKTRRNLSLNYNGNLYASIAYIIVTIISIFGAVVFTKEFGMTNAQSLPLLIGCGVLGIITFTQSIRLFIKYKYCKNKKSKAIQQAIDFRKNKTKTYNEAEKFILRRVEKMLNAVQAND